MCKVVYTRKTRKRNKGGYLMEIAIHSIQKHNQLQAMGVPCKRIEKNWKNSFHVFIYDKTEKVLEVLNANNKNI